MRRRDTRTQEVPGRVVEAGEAATGQASGFGARDRVERAQVGEPPTVPWRVELDPEEVAERFRWATRRGHPRYLWPEVSAPEWRAALVELERVVGEVLGGGCARLEPGSEGGSRALGVAGFTSGLGPLVGRWVEEGWVAADELTSRVFALHLWHGRERAAGRERELTRAVQLLNGAGIQPLVIKAAHTAPRYFPEPGARPAADVDLVVRPELYGRGERALLEGGYAREGGQRSPRKGDFRHAGAAGGPRSLELAHAASGCGVDLHAGLTRDFFGVRRVTVGEVEEVEERSEPATLGSGGVRGRFLRQPELVAYHALHASEGLQNLTLIRLVELALMIRADGASGALEWEALLELLRRAGGLRFAYPALVLTERLVPGTVEPEVVAVLRGAATPRMRGVVDGLRPSDAQRLESLSLEERFMWSATPAEHARRLVHMLLPAPTGGSPDRLARMYGERLWRLVRRRVRLGPSSTGSGA